MEIRNSKTQKISQEEVESLKKFDTIFFKIITRRCYDRLITFQPDSDNISRIAGREIDKNLFNYLLKNLLISISDNTKLQIGQFAKTHKAFSSAELVTGVRPSGASKQFSNRYEQLLAVEKFGQLIKSVCEGKNKSHERFVFGKLFDVQNRFKKLELASFFLKSIFKNQSLKRKAILFDKNLILKKNDKKIEVGLERIAKVIRKREIDSTKLCLRIARNYSLSFDIFERIYAENCSSYKKGCLKIISEYDKRPNLYNSIIHKKPNFLKFLDMFKILDQLFIEKLKHEQSRHVLSVLMSAALERDETMSHVASDILSEPNSDLKIKVTRLNGAHSLRFNSEIMNLSHVLKFVILKRKVDHFRTFYQNMVSSKLASKVKVPSEIQRKQIYAPRPKISNRDVQMLVLIVEQIIRSHLKRALGVFQANKINLSAQKNNKILYAKTTYLRKPATMGSFMHLDTTRLISNGKLNR